MNIFNPPICLAKELRNSWAINIVTEVNPERIPIETSGGKARLKMIYDYQSDDDWFACVIPLQMSWEPVDISKFKALRFDLYTEENQTGCIRFEDESGMESIDLDIDTSELSLAKEHTLSFDLSPLQDRQCNELDIKKIRLLKFIGHKGACFYISEVRLYDENCL
jgi:hypothetical protein